MLELCEAGVLNIVQLDQDSSKTPRYQPARPTSQLSPEQVLKLLSGRGNESLLHINPEI